jgi:hypothetical protein
MGIRLRHYREIAIELGVQTSKRDIFSETAIFESRATKVMWFDLSITIFRHQDDLYPARSAL